MSTKSLNAAFTVDELQVFETLLYKLGTVYSGWLLEELQSEQPCDDAAAYFESKLASVQSLIGDVRFIRGGAKR